MASPFRIDILDSNEERTGSGPITNAIELIDVLKLDAIGTLQFEFPAADPRNQLVRAGSRFDIYDEIDGYLGRFIYKSSTIRDRSGRAYRKVKCYNALRELTETNVGFRRGYHFEPVNQVIQDLVELVDGWTHNIDSGIGNTSVTYEGESVFAAIDVMRDRWGQHFRLTATPTRPRQLDFGAFGEDSGVIFQNVRGQMQYSKARHVGILQDITYSEDSDWLANRIIAIGAGQGEASITLQDATLGDYTVQSGTNKNGSLYYYIEDEDSIDQYGLKTRVATFPGIRPISNNATDLQRAKDALKLAAEAYLRRHLAPKVSYEIGDIAGLEVTPRVGDLVRVWYKGATEDVAYLDVNELFYLISIERRRYADGDRSAMAILSTTADQRTSDTDVMVDVVRDIKVLKLHIQPFPYRYEIHERDWCGGRPGPIEFSTVKRAQCRIKIDESVTDLTKVLLSFRTAPLFVYAQINFAGSQNWFDPIYSRNYPSDLSLYVNSVDVTESYGGIWAEGGLNVETEVTELDITELLKNAAGGMYQEHLIEIATAENRPGDTSVPGTTSVINAVASTGEVFFTVTIQATAQAILSS